jgi:ABC-type sugar transport system ATPase subunit
VLAPDTGVQRWLRGVGFAGAVMKDVLVQQFGSPEDIYDRPSNMYVAGFIGSPTMNFLPATLQRQGGHWAVELSSPQGKALLPLGPVRDPGADGKEVMVGIRPEHFHPSTRADAAALPVKVEVVEPTGADAFAAGRETRLTRFSWRTTMCAKTLCQAREGGNENGLARR